MKIPYKISILLLLSISSFSSCNPKTETKDEQNKQRVDADTSLSAIANLLDELKTTPPFNNNKQKQKQLQLAQVILSELAKLSGGFGQIKSGEIPYDDPDTTLAFLPRREKFIREFAYLSRYNLFPNYFQIDRESIKQIYDFGNQEKHDSLNVVRMYPVYDYRLIKYNKYSYAFMWADTNENVTTRINTKLIVDILDPCPPPVSNCK